MSGNDRLEGSKKVGLVGLRAILKRKLRTGELVKFTLDFERQPGKM